MRECGVREVKFHNILTFLLEPGFAKNISLKYDFSRSQWCIGAKMLKEKKHKLARR